MDMSPKTKYLVADYLLKAIYKAQGYDHYCHANCSGTYSKPYDKTRKCFLPVKSDSVSDKS